MYQSCHNAHDATVHHPLCTNGRRDFDIPINLDSVCFWRTVLYIPLAARVAGIMDHRQLRMLFLFPLGLFCFYLTDRITHSIRLYSDVSIYLFIVISLLVFLLGTHVHFAQVRNGRIPHAIARPRRREYLRIVGDIMHHQQFMKLKDHFHHTSHIYDHVVRVSYLSYVIAKAFGLDYHAAARGGLLHDFFLYDWRERKASDEKRSRHGKEHPHIALRNAKACFSVNELEADIIVKHMFPKTLALPRHPESVIVSVADKIATIQEYAILCKGKLVRSR